MARLSSYSREWGWRPFPAVEYAGRVLVSPLPRVYPPESDLASEGVVTEYRCTRCGRQLAHSNYGSCPHCGVRFSGVIDGGTRTYSSSSGGSSSGSSKELSPEEAKAVGCGALVLAAVAAVLIGLYATDRWPFKKDAAPDAAPNTAPGAPGAVVPAAPTGTPEPAHPNTANRIEATAAGLTFTPAFARSPTPGSRLGFVYRITPAGGAALDESALRDVMIEFRYDAADPPAGQYPAANVFVGRRRIPLRPIEDENTGTVLMNSSFPHGVGTGPPGGAPAGADAGWLVLCASKFRDGIRDGRAMTVEYPWTRTAAVAPQAADLDRMAVTGGVAEFVPPKEGFGYRFARLITPVGKYPDR